MKQMENGIRSFFWKTEVNFMAMGLAVRKRKLTEIVFNTAPVGYQEILSDPSYTYQTVVMAYPLIGNYGIAKEDFETKQPSIGGLAVRDYNDIPSKFPQRRHAGRGDETVSYYPVFTALIRENW